MRRLCHVLLSFFVLELVTAQTSTPPWTWKCIDGQCLKERNPLQDNPPQTHAECRLLCHKHASFWPLPSDQFNVGRQLIDCNVNNLDVQGVAKSSVIAPLINAAILRFNGLITKLGKANGRGTGLSINFDIKDQTLTQLTLDTDEGYKLSIAEEPQSHLVRITIAAANFFGARHALETLSQLIVFDDSQEQFRIPVETAIVDKPAYHYRGILLDTSRNYISTEAIKRTLEGMAMTKLNTFHWHITDSHSFPYVAASNPGLAQLGAYSPKKVYTPEMIQEIIEYAQIRGVRVLPEFDAPAHVGEGWQDTDFVVCFNKQPWQKYCVEPPCGQFDPTQWKLYDALEGIYRDMVQQFRPDIFHMGGDEVHFGCWNSTPHIVEWMKSQDWPVDDKGFVKLWNKFQAEALARLDSVAGKKLPIIMWTSTLTQKEYVTQSLPSDRYIIQVWTTGDNAVIGELLENDYRLIISNYDAMYLDCGFAGWVTGGNNWCSPYIGWQKLYNNNITAIGGGRSKQILGGEVALWTEQADDANVDSRIWPRAAALAERLWTDPATEWKSAEERMLLIRERLLVQGIGADALEPQWCIQNEGSCPLREPQH